MAGDAAKRLTVLWHMEDVTTKAYDEALGKLRESKVSDSLRRFRDNHKQHGEHLRGLAEAEGGTQPGAVQLEEYRETVLDAVAQAKSYDGVFSTLRVTEASMKLLYEQALEEHLSDETQRMLREHVKHEQEHMNLLEVATHGLAKT